MDALLVVESWFGNTQAIAESVARGLSQHGGRVRMVRVEDAPAEVGTDVDLIALGAPTHNGGLSTAASRQKAITAGGAHGATGVREWAETVELRDGLTVVLFDTVTSKSWLSGSAAKEAARILALRGVRTRVETKSFTVRGTKGPLRPGQADAAHDWGQHLAARRSTAGAREHGSPS